MKRAKIIKKLKELGFEVDEHGLIYLKAKMVTISGHQKNHVHAVDVRDIKKAIKSLKEYKALKSEAQTLTQTIKEQSK